MESKSTNDICKSEVQRAFMLQPMNSQSCYVTSTISKPISSHFYALPSFARKLSISADHSVKEPEVDPSNVFYTLSRNQTKSASRFPAGSLTLPLRTGSEPPPTARRRRRAPLELPPPPPPSASSSSAAPSTSLPSSSSLSSSSGLATSSGRAPPHEQQFSPEDIDRRYALMLRHSGRLNFDSRLHGVRCQRDDLRFDYELGQGICGVVHKAVHRLTGRSLAVKIMRRIGNSPEEHKRVIMDLEVVAKCHDCRHIVKYYGVVLLPSEVWICTELMTASLDRVVRCVGAGLPERVLGKVLLPILKALRYLKERHNIIHRDVKPSNFLINTGGCVKLCDFGICGQLEQSLAKTRTVGCTAYLAPERITLRSSYDIRSDVWSLGVSLVELATGCHPLRGCTTEMELLTRIVDDPPPRLPRCGFSDHFREFVDKCLTKDASLRPKYQQLLAHDFVKYHEQTQTDLAEWLAEMLAAFPAIDADPTATAAAAAGGVERGESARRRRLSAASSHGSSSGYGSVDGASPVVAHAARF